MLEQMLQRYDIKSDEDYYNALREILQEVALAGLYRGGFFQKAAFYGGTALRIFYNLDRYSEDLNQKIDTLDIEMAKTDIKRFIKDDRVLDIWSKDYFKELAERVVFN